VVENLSTMVDKPDLIENLSPMGNIPATERQARERAAALGSEGVRAVERAAGVETGERCFIYSARPAAPVVATRSAPLSGSADWRHAYPPCCGSRAALQLAVAGFPGVPLF